MSINKICFIGYGNHVKKTIIPSLKIKKKNIKIVTKKKITENFETFSDIKTALQTLDKSYVFFNSTPPKEHFSISKLILKSGFNIIVEKPICSSRLQYKILKKIADKKGLFLFENMMYFFSKQFLIFNNKIKYLNKIKKIEINFTIPKFSSGSFRTNHHIENSLLYDVGCYPISLVSFLGIKPTKIKFDFKKKDRLLNNIKLSIISKKIQFDIVIGFFEKYQNNVILKYFDGSILTFNHFFYGKKIIKENIYQNRNEIKRIPIKENNIFEEIFKFSNNKILDMSNKNEEIIKSYLKILDTIKKKLNNTSN